MYRYEEEHFLRLSHPGGRRGEGGRAIQDVMEELTDFSALKGLTKDERVRIITLRQLRIMDLWVSYSALCNYFRELCCVSYRRVRLRKGIPRGFRVANLELERGEGRKVGVSITYCESPHVIIEHSSLAGSKRMRQQ